MPSLEVLDIQKKKVGTIDLSDAVFGVKVNHGLVHQMIKAQTANRRRGTAKTKTRGEVRGGGKKPFRQKGTGNARRGSQRSPLLVGGGTSFGPQPRAFTQKYTKEMFRGAIRSALSDRVHEKRILIIDDFKLSQPKTKELFGILKKNFDLDSALIVDESNQNLERSGKNLPNVKILRSEGINVYDIVKHPWLLMTKTAAQSIEKKLLPTKKKIEG